MVFLDGKRHQTGLHNDQYILKILDFRSQGSNFQLNCLLSSSYFCCLRFGIKEDFSNKVKHNIHCFPFTFSYTWTMILFINSLMIVNVHSDYLNIHADNNGEAVKIVFILHIDVGFFLFDFYLFCQFPLLLYQFHKCSNVPIKQRHHVKYPWADSLALRLPRQIK